jgi:large subunit ribosomal protein L13e
MVKHNNIRPNIHLHKDYQRWIKTHFDQPLKKKRRARLRKLKAASKAPRPSKKLRPIVTCPTLKYNMRIRAGRGFSLLELKQAGLNAQYARTIGIAVDPRRRNRSQEGLSRNAARLKKYVSNLVLFPVAPKGKDKWDKEKMIKFLSEAREAETKMAAYKNYVDAPMPFRHRKKTATLVKLADVPDYNAYGTMKNELCVQHYHFKWRRRSMRSAYKKKMEEEKAKKKDAKAN